MEMTQDPDLHDTVEQAWHVHSAIDSWTAKVDAKASIVLSLQTAVLATAEGKSRAGSACTQSRLAGGLSHRGRGRARYVQLEGEGGENDRIVVTVPEAARRFGVTPATIRAWIEKGRIEGFQVEGDRRVYSDLHG